MAVLPVVDCRSLPSTIAATPGPDVMPDSIADGRVSRVFGPKGYMVVDHVNRLPERRPMLYAGLTR